MHSQPSTADAAKSVPLNSVKSCINIYVSMVNLISISSLVRYVFIALSKTPSVIVGYC